MKTLEQIQDRRLQIPMTVSWYLSDIGKAQGLQELFARQSPQKLKVLKEHAIAQSVISSNRIEGVTIDDSRIGTVVFGHPSLRDRDEIEVAGYRDALNLIHTQGAALPVNEETILNLHKLSRGESWDAGQYKDKPVDIIEKFAGGGERVRFRSVLPKETPEFTRKLVSLIKKAYDEFEERAGQLKSPRGTKTELIMSAIDGLPQRFSLVDVEHVCPGVSRDMVRKVLKDMQKQQKVECSGRGPGAVWEKR